MLLILELPVGDVLHVFLSLSFAFFADGVSLAALFEELVFPVTEPDTCLLLLSPIVLVVVL